MNAYKFGASVLILGSMALPAMADDVYYDTARVTSVVPQTERINTPHEECRTEYIRDSYPSGERSMTGSIIGGIAGGLLGSQIGKGNGRVAGAAVGAATGAIVGDRIDNSNRVAYGTRPVQTCTLVDEWHTVDRGYLVTYRFHGREYTTTMAQHPGRDLRVRVAVAPDMHYRVSLLEPQYQYHPRDNGRHRGWDKHRDNDRW